MDREELLQKIAQLESINDQLMAELTYVDHLMRAIGFAHGLEGVKTSAEEIIENGCLEAEEHEDHGLV